MLGAFADTSAILGASSEPLSTKNNMGHRAAPTHPPRRGSRVETMTTGSALPRFLGRRAGRVPELFGRTREERRCLDKKPAKRRLSPTSSHDRPADDRSRPTRRGCSASCGCEARRNMDMETPRRPPETAGADWRPAAIRAAPPWGAFEPYPPVGGRGVSRTTSSMMSSVLSPSLRWARRSALACCFSRRCCSRCRFNTETWGLAKWDSFL